MNQELERLLISAEDSIADAMRAIDLGGLQIALAVDPIGGLIGTVTDGDIRRALLAGRTLDDSVTPHVARAPLVVSPLHSRTEVLDLMRARQIAAVPIVDANGRLVGLHVMRALLGSVDRPNLAVIMAGGKGTRLAPLTRSMPKPMVSVAGRPILERLVLHFVGAGIGRVVIAVNYMAEMIESHFGDGSDFGCSIAYVREQPTRPLGTGGALGLVPRVADPDGFPMIVANGDLLTRFAVADLLQFHEASGAVATVAVREYTHEVPFGVVESEDRGFLGGFMEKPVASWRINAGVYVIEPHLTMRIPEGADFPLPALLQDCLQRGEKVALWELSDEWYDVGSHTDLRRARGED